MNQDIKLCYFGGSGGFFLLHLLLYSRKFVCQFDNTLNLDQIIEIQWNITNPHAWKSTEFWPNNLATKQLKTKKSKIYFFCNPIIDEVDKFPGKTVLLYTDKTSQIELSYFKRAFIFYNDNNYVADYRSQLRTWQQHYNNIKDPSWPKCYGPQSFKNLPHHIKEELWENPYTHQYLDIKKFGLRGRTEQEQLTIYHKNKCDSGLFLSNGTEVLPPVKNFYSFADTTIKLQNVVKDLNTLSTLTNLPVNQSQIDLKNKWISLHPIWLLEKIDLATELDE